MSASDETIEKLTKDLNKLKSGMNRDSTILLVVAVLLFAVFLGYFIYGYNQFREITEPKMLMDVAEDMVGTKIDDIRKTLETEVDNNAETWAAQLSEQALAQIPQWKKNLEGFVVKQIEEKITESVDEVEPKFDELINKENETLKKAFASLKKDKDISEELVGIITKEVDERLKTSVQADSESVLNNMIMLKAKMRKLKSGQNLNDEESLERQILTTIRLIQSQNKSE